MGQKIDTKMRWLLAGILSGSVALTGCGGGGDDDDDSSRGSGSDRTPDPSYVSIKDTSIREGAEKGIAKIEVRLSPTSTEAVTAQYETKDGTAKAGEDYESKSGEITFGPGTGRAYLEIPILGDEVHEPDEYFEITLSSVTGARMKDSESKAAVTIQNDDERPYVSFDTVQQSVAESVGTTRVTATLSERSGYTVEAQLSVQGTARDGDDYEISDPLTLTFEPGTTEVSLDVNILPDTIPEGGETIKFQFEDVKEASAPGKDQIAAHTIIILGDNALNDTGMTTFSNGSVADLRLEPASYPGQDGSHGRDTEYHPDDDGHAGFSFTKLDYDGNPLPANASTWSCTRDNVTGAVWENKRPDQNLEATVLIDENDRKTYIEPQIRGNDFRAGNFRYAWRNPDGASNGGSSGVVESREARLQSSNPVTVWLNGDDKYPDRHELPGYCGYEAGVVNSSYCNTRSYIEHMNAWGVCGFNDWRMPEIEELRSLANHEVAGDFNEAPEQQFFSNLQPEVRYLSQTPAADNESSAWCYDFAEGEVKLCQKGSYRG